MCDIREITVFTLLIRDHFRESTLSVGVRFERGTDVQETTIPIVDIPRTVPIQSSPARQL